MLMHLLKLFLKFFKIGLFTFGGGYAMIPLVQEVVEEGWISQDQFNNMIGLSEITPGPIALNMATFVGATSGGFLGGLIATLGVVLPSFIITCIVAKLLAHFSNNKYLKSALKGTMAVAIGLLIFITVQMTLQILTNFGSNEKFSFNIDSLITFGFVLITYVSMWIILRKKPNAIATILMSLLVGLSIYFGYYFGFVAFILVSVFTFVIKIILKKKSA